MLFCPAQQTRERKVDLSSKLGKTQVVTAASTPSQQGGWYCEICKCGLKDSINYLDHINGKKHQRELGFSMRVERSTVTQVGGVFSAKGKVSGRDTLPQISSPIL